MALIPAATLFANAVREDIAVFPVSFAPNGATTVIDVTTIKGYASGVVRSDTGVFTVTLSSTVPDIVGVSISPQHNAKGGTGTAGVKYELGAVSAANGTLVINCMTDGTTTLVEMAANAANRINLLVAISRSRTT